MSATYNKSSPYYTTEITNGYLDVMASRDIPGQRDDILFTVTKNYEYRPDLLAYELYGDVNLWWVFAVRNKNIIKDPLFDFESGLKIYLPKLSTLKDSLGL